MKSLTRQKFECVTARAQQNTSRYSSTLAGAVLCGLFLYSSASAQAEIPSPDYWQLDPSIKEAYVDEPLPAGFSVMATELEGPVFADPNGMTLYTWPLKSLRNGNIGDRVRAPSTCTDKVTTETAGLMSPYPAGLKLPDLDTRPSCEDLWPPVIAEEGAEPLGKWTIIPREDGRPQWAYDGYPVYTSVKDKWPGDVYGATKRERRGDGPGLRVPIGPSPDVPAEFRVVQTSIGRMITNHTGYSIYSSDADEPNKSNCVAECLETWQPVLAPESASAKGEWSPIERSPGVLQWTFRGKPVYTYVRDTSARGMRGSDEPGWHNVFTQRVPAPPDGFTIQDTRTGQVLADAQGKTLYVHNCGDDSPDQLSCEHPSDSQAYRLSVCGANDPERCLQMFPPVEAPGEVETDNRLWRTAYIDPLTGKYLENGAEGGMHVWTYRDRPVYTFGLDTKPGDINADNWGEFNGWRNGYKAFWLRDDYYSNTQ